MSIKKYQRDLDRELESAGYALQRTKRHRIYYNAELEKTITASATPSDSRTHYAIRRMIRRNANDTRMKMSA
jgi:hypothetical protein